MKTNPFKSLYRRLTWDRFEEKDMQTARKRLVNKGFTIICSNCVGGVMYHLLGLPFDSPTINIWIDKKEFCKFAANLPHYFSQELRFYNKEDRDCPCAFLGEGENAITIVFVHYDTEEQARYKWEERKKRIHWDNLYIISCDGNNATEEDFALLDKTICRRKIIFTSHEHPEIKDSFVLNTLKKYPNAARMQIVRHPITGRRSWQREFDYVAFFNGDKLLRLER